VEFIYGFLMITRIGTDYFHKKLNRQSLQLRISVFSLRWNL